MCRLFCGSLQIFTIEKLTKITKNKQAFLVKNRNNRKKTQFLLLPTYTHNLCNSICEMWLQTHGENRVKSTVINKIGEFHEINFSVANSCYHFWVIFHSTTRKSTDMLINTLETYMCKLWPNNNNKKKLGLLKLKFEYNSFIVLFQFYALISCKKRAENSIIFNYTSMYNAFVINKIQKKNLIEKKEFDWIIVCVCPALNAFRSGSSLVLVLVLFSSSPSS